MRKARLYLILATGFLILPIANFCIGDLDDALGIIINFGWLVIAGFYFLQYLKHRKTT